VRRVPTIVFVAIALALAVGLATAASPFASASPDGLTRVAGDQGFLERGTTHSLQEHSVIPGYAFPGIDDPRLAKGVAGFVGTLGIFAVGAGLAWGLRRSRTRRTTTAIR
jgi:hypothetical protein